MPKKYSDEFKKQVIAYYDKQHSIVQTAEKYNLAPSSVVRWINDYTVRGSLEKSFTLSDFKALKRKYERTVHLLEIIKLTKLLDEVELQRKRPHGNAVIESFFSTFKKEEAYRRNYRSENEFKKSVDEYVAFYNERRPHSTLAFKSPNRFEELYGKV